MIMPKTDPRNILCVIIESLEFGYRIEIAIGILTGYLSRNQIVYMLKSHLYSQQRFLGFAT